jgi:hypothetical protein
MTEKKKTEITFGFASHFPSSAKRMLKRMGDADVILVELPPRIIKGLAKGAPIKSLIEGSINADYEEVFLSGLKQKMKEGKKVIGYESLHDQKRWTADEFEKLKNAEKMLGAGFMSRDMMTYAKNMAEFNKMREAKSAQWIKRNISMLRGKRVYIEAGAAHTGLYHVLKRDLGSKDLSVKRDFIDRVNYEKGVLSMFKPSDQMVRMIRFNTKSAKDPAAFAKLAEEEKRFLETHFRLMGEYISRGHPKAAARDMAHFAALKRRRK